MIIGEGILKDIGRIGIWFFLRYLALAMPSPLELAVHSYLGLCFYCLGRKKRELVRKNLDMVLGPKPQTNRQVRMAVENHFIDQYLIFSFPKIGPQNIDRYLAVDGLRHLNSALQHGKGAIIIHGHVGPRLLPLFALGLRGYRMHQIEGPIAADLSPLGRYCARQKQALERLIPAEIINGQRFLRSAFEALKRNEVVMIAGDGMGGGKFMGQQVGVDFLGYRLRFPAGPVILASKTGASLVPLFTLGGDKGAPYRSVIYPSWVVPKARLGQEELAVHVAKFVSLLESVVKRYPHLWHFWDEFFDRTVDPGARHKC
jgi:phosphatidylinositol dimannoside acyltransferase